MKRRQLIQNIAAVAALPMLPGRAYAAGSTVSAALYAKAIHYSRVWGTCVPEMYTSALGLNLDQANILFSELVAGKVIATPNANGFARAVAPYFKAPSLAHTVSETINNSVEPKIKHDPVSSEKGSIDHVKEIFDEKLENETQEIVDTENESFEREDQIEADADPSQPLNG